MNVVCIQCVCGYTIKSLVMFVPQLGAQHQKHPFFHSAQTTIRILFSQHIGNSTAFHLLTVDSQIDDTSSSTSIFFMEFILNFVTEKFNKETYCIFV